MGLLELLLAIPLAVGGGAVTLVLAVLAWRNPGAASPARSPLPLPPLLLSLLCVITAPLIGVGLGALALEHLLLPQLELARLVITAPQDQLGAQLRGAGLLTAWLALPGMLAAARLLLSRDRSWKAAALLGSVGWLGFGLGLVMGRWLVLPAVLGELAVPGSEITIELTQAAGMAASAQLALGVVGACGPVVWLVAGSSHVALRWTTIATMLMPAGALTLAALTTPPDVISQVVVAALIGLCWLVGLALGAVTVKLRRG